MSNPPTDDSQVRPTRKSSNAIVRLALLGTATVVAAVGLASLVHATTGDVNLTTLAAMAVGLVGAAGLFLVARLTRSESIARGIYAVLLEADAEDGAQSAIELPDGSQVHASPGIRTASADSGDGVMARIAAYIGERSEETLARLLAMRTSALDGRPVRQDFRSGAGGSTGRWHEITVRLIPSGQLVWRVRDVSARLNNLAVTETRLHTLEAHLDGLAAGVYVEDQDGLLLYANRAMAQWLGRPLEEVRSGTARLKDLADVTVLEGTRSLRPRTGEGALLSTYEAEFESDGRTVVCGVAWPKGRGPLSLRTAIFENAPVGIVVTDDSLMIQDSNALFRRLVNHGAPTGHSVFDFVDTDDRHRLELITREADKAPVEVKLAREKQTVASVFAAPIQERNAGAGHVFHFVDVSEQKRLEVQFAQGQKMQAVGQLAGGIAHDFNNLLTAMIGFCDLLLQRHRQGDQSFADAMQIKQNANRAAGLVRQLLAFSRQQTMQQRVLNVTDVLAELSNLLRRLLGEKVELEMKHDRDPGLVMGDQGQLEQVIINLAVNARDAMPDGGRLMIRTENVTTDSQLEERGEVMPPGSYVCLEVADTGMGISKEVMDHLFEPFFTTKEVGAGTGLGLSTVYGIVRQSGGYVFAHSDGEGKGASFKIYLKRYEGSQVPDRTVSEGEAVGDLTGGGTVLLVEDEDPVRLFSARALRSKGYQVVEARTGEAALEILGDDQEQFDLLVTDMMMPKVDGATLIREARKTRPDMPVICISGYTQESVAKEVVSLPRVYFLPKPFSLKQLAAKVKEAMQRAPESVSAE